MIISVVGMGKIGLPLAVQYASKGHSVFGVDINQKTVDLVNAGKEPFPGETGLAEALPDLRQKRLLSATTSYETAVPQSDVVVVVVPLFVDENDEPDFGWMDSATRSIGANLTANTLVIYETTLPIGTTRNRWKPMLERESGLREGQDFHVVFSPERVLTGRVFEDLRKYPKLVGGLSPEGTQMAIDFYGSALDFDIRADLARENGVWDLGSAEAAEMAKLAETTYRDVNIALANEFAAHAEEIGVNVYDVISACNSQPFSNIHQPGISVGGHCIPVYPRLYLSTSTKAEVVKTARQVNSSSPRRAVERIERELGGLSNKTVAILGVAYRPGVKEVAFSGAFQLQAHIEKLGGRAVFLDPIYSETELEEMGFGTKSLSAADSIILHTCHEDFLKLTRAHFPNVRVIYDGRNCLDPANWNGAQLISLGVGQIVVS